MVLLWTVLISFSNIRKSAERSTFKSFSGHKCIEVSEAQVDVNHTC